jgi:hypothetical protein
MSDLKPIGEILPEREGKRPSRKRLPDEPALSPHDLLVLELIEVGIGRRKAESLVAHHPVELIRRQLDWLPMRAARRPASLLISAIERDYDAPVYADE